MNRPKDWCDDFFLNYITKKSQTLGTEELNKTTVYFNIIRNTLYQICKSFVLLLLSQNYV